MRYNIVTAGIKAIKEDKTNPLHLVKKIRTATTGGNEKTFKILLANGHTVKAEADAVRRIAYCGDISPYHINCSDRQYLNKNEHGRPEDIQPAEIIQISHGSRILYTA